MSEVDRKRRHERDDESESRRSDRKRHKHKSEHKGDRERHENGREDRDKRDHDDRSRRHKDRNDRRRRHSRSRSNSKERPSKRSRRSEKKIDLKSVVVGEEEMMRQMGFAGFDTTKNKKVEGNVDGVAKVNKPRKYRQYMNRKGGFNRPLDFIA